MGPKRRSKLSENRWKEEVLVQNFIFISSPRGRCERLKVDETDRRTDRQTVKESSGGGEINSMVLFGAWVTLKNNVDICHDKLYGALTRPPPADAGKRTVRPLASNYNPSQDIYGEMMFHIYQSMIVHSHRKEKRTQKYSRWRLY